MIDSLPPKDKDPYTWTHEEVGAYLKSMNLADNYVQVFIDEGINGMVLMNLTREELKEEPFNMKTFAPIKTVTATIDTLKQQMSEQREPEVSSVPERKLSAPDMQPISHPLPGPMMDSVHPMQDTRGHPMQFVDAFPQSQLGFAPQYFTASNVAYPLLPPPPLFEHGMNPDFLPKKAFFTQLDQKYGDMKR
eukprot:TRINITY_DN10216_c1_g1_i1.p1 TRINITY_DN10216_c1_g1~~TRINITY_DN10216_c1_g1_i1.p1  ORF type:complete len:213 (+),score=43.20 TRINITY_DN10216_c1_g1_i1:68-640(+)